MHGGLHAEADAEVRDLLLARVADAVQHALDAALAEAAGHEDAVEAGVAFGVVRIELFESLGLDPIAP
jgi:hypothetical protein